MKKSLLQTHTCTAFGLAAEPLGIPSLPKDKAPGIRLDFVPKCIFQESFISVFKSEMTDCFYSCAAIWRTIDWIIPTVRYSRCHSPLHYRSL